jgi:hypothetical protein
MRLVSQDEQQSRLSHGLISFLAEPALGVKGRKKDLLTEGNDPPSLWWYVVALRC